MSKGTYSWAFRVVVVEFLVGGCTPKTLLASTWYTAFAIALIRCALLVSISRVALIMQKRLDDVYVIALA